MHRNSQSKSTEKYSFIGVFIVGVLLLGITANYYINKEAGEDRDARNRRIANEMNKLHATKPLASLPPTSEK